LPEFLQQQLLPKEGDIVEIPSDSPVYRQPVLEGGTSSHQALQEASRSFHYRPEDGEVVGRHQGAHYFTIGQRKGLNVGGKPEPLFVIGTDVDKNIVYVGMGDQHPGLYRPGLFIPEADVHWLRDDLRLAPGEERKLQARIRYRQPLQEATLHQAAEGLYITFAQPQKSITPGQFAAWYDGEELLGSGVIG
jgi:tRNA-specific 2-thiouridylase